jgi:hypothetical protein
MTLVFLDHSFHEKTKSSSFFLEAWGSLGWDTRLVYDDSWEGKTGVTAAAIRALQPDLLISWQVIRPPEFYREVGCRLTVLIPMYDASAGTPFWKWWGYRDFYFVHFSDVLFRRLRRLGVPGFRLQYFPPPGSIESKSWESRSRDAFFWFRRDILAFDNLTRIVTVLFSGRRPKLHIHRALDPGHDAESFESADLDIIQTEWFAKRSDYLEALRDSRLFLAPRLTEGIGMSFLEAMSEGCVVVAHNAPTMNEYIDHGKTGILLDYRNPSLTGLKDLPLETIATNARDSVRHGRARFEADLHAFITGLEALVAEKPRVTALGLVAGLLSWGRRYLLRPLKGLVTRHAHQP